MGERLKSAAPVTPARKRWRWYAVALFLVLYPLSTGPVYWICRKAGHGQGVATIAYAPLFLLADKWESPFGELLVWYLSWWDPIKFD